MGKQLRKIGRAAVTCLLFGVLVAGVAAWYSVHHRRAELAAAAAQAHQSTGHVLAAGAVGLALSAAAVAFVLSGIVVAVTRPGRRRREAEGARRAPAGRAYAGTRR
jgi:hypothetical protein